MPENARILHNNCPKNIFSRILGGHGGEHFTDLDYADDVALLAEMLQTLVAGLLVLQDEAAPLGLQINWTKTKIQQIGEPRLPNRQSRWQQRMSIW